MQRFEKITHNIESQLFINDSKKYLCYFLFTFLYQKSTAIKIYLTKRNTSAC